MLLISLLLFFISLPYWLPACLVQLRMLVFTWINGSQGVQIPSKQFDSHDFKKIYCNPAANGRSHGAKLSDLFWYWLSPGPQMHQEHLEPGPRYQKIADYTKCILAKRSRGEVEMFVEQCLQSVLLRPDQFWTLHRVRDWMMPLFATFFYELVFDEPCSADARQLIVGHANDVVTALKCCGLRHMKKRYALTDYLVNKLKKQPLSITFPEGFSLQEQVYYLQGTFFNTGVVQMSDAMSHIVMLLAKHSAIQDKMANEPENRSLHNHFINEALRLFPLFGIAHRILCADIILDNTVLKKDTVVCFNYPNYHKLGFPRPNAFKPTRWETCSAKQSNYIPFGITENRPCPAQSISLIVIRTLTKQLLMRYRFSTTAKHTRSLPSRAPVLVRQVEKNMSLSKKVLLLVFIKIRDQWEDLFRSLVQLILGTKMVLEAHRLKLCENYFNANHGSLT